MLYNEVRPRKFSGVVGQKSVVRTIQNQVKNDSIMNMYILAGQFGSGKTTMARIIAMAANCSHPDEDGNPCGECEHCKAIMSGLCQDYMELDAASKTGVDDIRVVIDDVSYTPTFLKKKVYIIDEVHMLSKSAFNSFLKTLEEPPEYAIFILCTTELKAIPATVRSRAAQFTFSQISDEDIFQHLKKIVAERGIIAEDAGLRLIAKNSDGAMRNALSLLEQASSVSESGVTAKNVQDMLGVADCKTLFQLLEHVCKANTVSIVEVLNSIFASGKDMMCLCDDLLSVITDGIVYSCGHDDGLIANSEEYCRKIHQLVGYATREQLCWLSQQVLEMRDSVKKGASKSIFLVNFLRITNQGASQNQKMLLERIEELERVVSVLSSGEKKTMAYEETATETPLMTGSESEMTDDTLPVSMEVVVAKDGSDASEPEETITMEEDDEAHEAERTFAGMVDMYSLFNASEFFARDSAESVDEGTFAEAENSEASVSDDAMHISSGDIPDNIRDAIEDLCEDNSSFWSAVHEGAVASVDNGVVTYKTPLEPIARMLNAYFEAYNIDAVAQFDATIEL